MDLNSDPLSLLQVEYQDGERVVVNRTAGDHVQPDGSHVTFLKEEKNGETFRMQNIQKTKTSKDGERLEVKQFHFKSFGNFASSPLFDTSAGEKETEEEAIDEVTAEQKEYEEELEEMEEMEELEEIEEEEEEGDTIEPRLEELEEIEEEEEEGDTIEPRLVEVFNNDDNDHDYFEQKDNDYYDEDEYEDNNDDYYNREKDGYYYYELYGDEDDDYDYEDGQYTETEDYIYPETSSQVTPQAGQSGISRFWQWLLRRPIDPVETTTYYPTSDMPSQPLPTRGFLTPVEDTVLRYGQEPPQVNPYPVYDVNEPLAPGLDDSGLSPELEEAKEEPEIPGMDNYGLIVDPKDPGDSDGQYENLNVPPALPVFVNEDGSLREGEAETVTWPPTSDMTTGDWWWRSEQTTGTSGGLNLWDWFWGEGRRPGSTGSTLGSTSAIPVTRPTTGPPEDGNMLPFLEAEADVGQPWGEPQQEEPAMDSIPWQQHQEGGEEEQGEEQDQQQDIDPNQPWLAGKFDWGDANRNWNDDTSLYGDTNGLVEASYDNEGRTTVFPTEDTAESTTITYIQTSGTSGNAWWEWFLARTTPPPPNETAENLQDIDPAYIG